MSTATQPRIAYDKVGDGTTGFLCLPGWAAERTMFRDVLPGLGSTHTAVALDWRGHGGSERVEGSFGDAELLDDALTVIEETGLERVIPVAQAHAGWVAIELRKRLGAERVPGIVLTSWMVLGPPPPFAGMLAQLQDRDTWREAVGALAGMWTAGVSHPGVLAFVESMGEYPFEIWSDAARAIAGEFEATPSPLAVIAGLGGCPTLHLYAQPRDDGFLQAQQEFAASNPWFTVERVEGSSHFPTIEDPAAAVSAIDRFVARL